MIKRNCESGRIISDHGGGISDLMEFCTEIRAEICTTDFGLFFGLRSTEFCTKICTNICTLKQKTVLKQKNTQKCVQNSVQKFETDAEKHRILHGNRYLKNHRWFRIWQQNLVKSTRHFGKTHHNKAERWIKLLSSRAS
jgi:hypothetical protein